MAHDIIDNRNEKLVDHVESILVFPSLTHSLKGLEEFGSRGTWIPASAGMTYCRPFDRLRANGGQL
jgi:hypothetical protein